MRLPLLFRRVPPIWLLLMLLTSCTPVALGDLMESSSPQVLITQNSTAIVCNCGESNEVITRQVERSYTVTSVVQWEFRGSVGVGFIVKAPGVEIDIAPAIEGVYGRASSTSRTQTVGFSLPARPNSQIEYKIQWSEVWQPGIIRVTTSQGPDQVIYRYLREVQGNLMDQGGRDIGCEQGCLYDSGVRTETPPLIAGTPLTATIINGLVLPVQIQIDGTERGTIDAQSRKVFVISGYPARVRFDVMLRTVSDGLPLGDRFWGEWSEVYPNAELQINNIVGDQYYFYPIVTNNTDFACSFSINDGYPSENRPSASIPHHVGMVGLGYYRFYSNSNVTLFCDPTNPSRYRWWGIRSDQGDQQTSLWQYVQSTTGVLNLVVSSP